MDFHVTVELFQEPKLGRVERPITALRRGRVFYEGSYWPARRYDSLEATSISEVLETATVVKVVGRQGLTLLVVPAIATAAYA